ncbi:MAG: putative FlaG/YvyC family protein [bacterium]|jgi:uncharacterized FlaG/YvyC family protein
MAKINSSVNTSVPISGKKEISKIQAIKVAEELEAINAVEKENAKAVLERLVGEDLKNSITWKDLRFYQREIGGQIFIDVVNQATGETIRTIPEAKAENIREHTQAQTGIILNIHG